MELYVIQLAISKRGQGSNEVSAHTAACLVPCADLRWTWELTPQYLPLRGLWSRRPRFRRRNPLGRVDAREFLEGDARCVLFPGISHSSWTFERTAVYYRMELWEASSPPRMRVYFQWIKCHLGRRCFFWWHVCPRVGSSATDLRKRRLRCNRSKILSRSFSSRLSLEPTRTALGRTDII